MKKIGIMEMIIILILLGNTIAIDESNEFGFKEQIDVKRYVMESNNTWMSIYDIVRNNNWGNNMVSDNLGKQISTEDIYWLSMIVSAEAKGEPLEGKIAVANVVLNRVKSEKFPNTVKEVIFQKGQFSPVANGSIYEKPYGDAVKATEMALQGERVVGDDVLYFYNPKIVSRGNWIRTRKVETKINNHVFAK